MKPNYYIMNACSWKPGFFCSYQSAIGFLNFCEEQKPLGFRIEFEMGLYFDPSVGPNWWEYYFEPVNVGVCPPDAFIESVGDMLKSHWNTEVISNMTRESAAYIINKYIKVKPHIQNKIDQFVKNNFNNNFVIGIHYRGTDKSSEARRVPFHEVYQEVIKHLSDKQNNKIFVATDEQNFLNYMKSKFGNVVVHIDANRSPDDHTPLHHLDGDMVSGNRYLLGEEAVIDCYLLSKTNLMIRTHSNLSSSAANINPLLPVINLNHATYRAGLR